MVRHLGGKRFLLNATRVPRGWKVVFHARDPKSVEQGMHTTYWVARLSPSREEILVHEGDFGRLPVSEAMRERYVGALKALLGEAEVTAQAMGDAVSMVARISAQNHADWLTVWRILGEPKTGEAKALLAAINGVREARKAEPDFIPALLMDINEQFGRPLRAALRTLTQN